MFTDIVSTLQLNKQWYNWTQSKRLCLHSSS